MTTCSLADPNICQTICPRDPTEHESTDSQVNIAATPIPTANVLAPATNHDNATTSLPLSPSLQETASLLLADGVPLPSPEDLASLTETLSLLRGLGLKVPPEEESWSGFSLDDKTNAELERMLDVLEPYVGELPPEEMEGEGEGEGYDIGFADILAILMAAEERDEEKEREKEGKERKGEGEGNEEVPIEELFIKDPVAAHERLAPLLETKTQKVADIKRRDVIVEKQVNVTEHKGINGETTSVSVSQTSETDGVKIDVEINGQEYR